MMPSSTCGSPEGGFEFRSSTGGRKQHPLIIKIANSNQKQKHHRTSGTKNKTKQKHQYTIMSWQPLLCSSWLSSWFFFCGRVRKLLFQSLVRLRLRLLLALRRRRTTVPSLRLSFFSSSSCFVFSSFPGSARPFYPHHHLSLAPAAAVVAA